MGHTVFYHGNNVDGYISACNLKKAIGDTLSPHFCPISYGRAVNFFKHYDIDSHTHTIWLINICLKTSHLQELLDEGYTVIVIDTHKSSIDHISRIRHDDNAKRLRFIVGTAGYCTASLISAIGKETLLNMRNIEPGIPRVEVGRLDNGKLEAQFISNISTRGLDRSRVTEVDQLLEAYEVGIDTVTSLYQKGQSLHFWMIQNNVQLEKPVTEINAIFAQYELNLRDVLLHGQIISEAHKRIINRALGAAVIETIQTRTGPVTISVSWVPDGLEDYYGDIYCHRTKGDCIAVACITNGAVEATSLSLRSTTVDVLPIVKRLHGGGDTHSAGTTLSGTHHSLHEIKYLVRGALLQVKEAIEDSIQVA